VATQWIDNNLTYLDAELLKLYLEEDHDYMKLTWPEYHYKHACRLGICPNCLELWIAAACGMPRRCQCRAEVAAVPN